LTERPVQQEMIETKRIGSIDWNVFRRYIQAGGCGIVGLLGLIFVFILTSATVVLSNWWLSRWSNSERTRYSVNNSTAQCALIEQSKIIHMTDDEWFNERNQYFYILLGKAIDVQLSRINFGLIDFSHVHTRIKFIQCHIVIYSNEYLFHFVPYNGAFIT
jgi:hypothetical protein